MAYENHLEKAWEKIKQMEPFKMDSGKPPRFRLSSSPFCAYRFLFQWYDFIKTGERDFWDYSADFYTMIGTAIHSALQKWVPLNNPGLYLGNWVCPVCGKRIEAATGPKLCKECKRWMIYDEFSFTEKPGFTGHCDGILLINNRLPKKLGVTIDNTVPMDKYIRSCKDPVEAVVLEYKSAGSYKARRITSPTPNNKAQALMYVPCANRKMQELGLNVRVIGAVVKYVSRDNPNSASNDFFLPVEDEKFFLHNKKIVRAVYKAVKTGDSSFIKDAGIPCRGCYKGMYSDCGYIESCKSLRKEVDMFLEETKDPIKKDFIFLKNLESR